MWRRFVNRCSYVWYVLTLDWFQLFSAVFDIIILIFALCRWRDIAFQPTILLVIVGIIVNLVWQCFNVAGHFTFLKDEKPGAPLESLLPMEDGKKDFTAIKINENLFDPTNPFRYETDMDLGVLKNEGIDKLLQEKNRPIILSLDKEKREKTSTYIRQYKETLLKFLNQKWHDVNQKGGMFINDSKVCFASELYDDDGVFEWRIAKGCYYHGYLTNFIFSKYVGGSHYRLFPPMNVDNKTEIKSFSESDFSDHIGVSTLLYTNDGYVLIFRQASNSGYNAGMYMPSGSGSLDFSDYKKGDDLSAMIVKGAERELQEESSMKKKLSEQARLQNGIEISTTVLRFYRDLERGGKPEFCCISQINKKKEFMTKFIAASASELERGEYRWEKLDKSAVWLGSILPSASLSLIMNYQALKDYLITSK